MIPDSIKRTHIFEAIKKIDSEGVPSAHQSIKFDLAHGGKRYLLKYVLSVAHIFVNGEKWPHELFSGGNETNSFLAAKGFTVVAKDSTTLLPLLPIASSPMLSAGC
jgi:hypothetical protein